MSEIAGTIRKSAPSGGLAEIAAKRITELVRSRQLVGGETIVEQKLAEDLGISRTPLREALQRLEGEGMIEKNSGRSYRVRRVYMEEYMQSIKTRMLLEPEAAANAVGRIPANELKLVGERLAQLKPISEQSREEHWDFDDLIHQAFGRHCGNAVLMAHIERLRVSTRLFEIADLDERFEADLVEHGDILEALISEDGNAARKAVKAHLKSLIQFSLRQVS